MTTALVVLLAALVGLAARAIHRERRTFRAIVADEIDDQRTLDHTRRVLHTPLYPNPKDTP